MKAAHETRIEIVSAIQEDRASHVLRYAADVGTHESPVRTEQISAAMLPNRYPAEGRAKSTSSSVGLSIAIMSRSSGQSSEIICNVSLRRR